MTSKTDPMRFAVGPHVSGGIGIEFRKPISWIVLSREEAIKMAFKLLDHAGVKYVEKRPRFPEECFVSQPDRDMWEKT